MYMSKSQFTVLRAYHCQVIGQSFTCTIPLTKFLNSTVYTIKRKESYSCYRDILFSYYMHHLNDEFIAKVTSTLEILKNATYTGIYIV